MACCFWRSVWTSAYYSRMEVSKPRCISIRHTWCTHVALNNRCVYLNYINGSDNTTDFQQNPSPFLQGCVSHFWSFCLWLNFVDACSSFWVVHLHYMCICYGIVTLSLTQTDSRTLSRNSWVSLALHEAIHGLCDWFRQSFQSVWTAPSQASTESSMPIPNMTEKHVVGSENNV